MAKAVTGLRHSWTSLSDHRCFLHLLITRVRNILHAKFHLKVASPACASSWTTNSPSHPATSKGDQASQIHSPLLPLSSEALQWPRRPQEICPLCPPNFTSSIHPVLTQSQPATLPPQTHQAHSPHETVTALSLSLENHSPRPEVANFLYMAEQ